jgi:probable HAF family extracellular repeat protein
MGDKYITINSPYGGSTALYDINNFGQIVGASSDGSGNAHGFIDTNGAFTMVDPPDSTRTNANGLNDFGTVVGLYTTKENRHGFGFLLA